MLDKQDLQAIKELIIASEERTRHDFRLLLEADIDPKLQLLIEGHQNLLDTLALKSRVEALEEEVSFLRQVVKAHSQEIEELKKAQ